MPRELKRSDDLNSQDGTYVAKKLNKVDALVKDRADDIVTKQNITENMLSRLSTTLYFVRKEVGQNSLHKRLFIKGIGGRENGRGVLFIKYTYTR